MKKQIALQTVTVEDVLIDFFGGCYSYVSPGGNRFFDSINYIEGDSFVDSVDYIEVCMFSSGRLSLCGLGEYKKEFSNAMEFRLFVKDYMKK